MEARCKWWAVGPTSSGPHKLPSQPNLFFYKGPEKCELQWGKGLPVEDLNSVLKFKEQVEGGSSILIREFAPLVKTRALSTRVHLRRHPQGNVNFSERKKVRTSPLLQLQLQHSEVCYYSVSFLTPTIKNTTTT